MVGKIWWLKRNNVAFGILQNRIPTVQKLILFEKRQLTAFIKVIYVLPIKATVAIGKKPYNCGWFHPIPFLYLLRFCLLRYVVVVIVVPNLPLQ